MIIYCEKCQQRFDTDRFEECPRCDDRPKFEPPAEPLFGSLSAWMAWGRECANLAQQQAKRAEDLLANQTHIQNQIQAALGNGANEQLWQPGEHWLIAACRVISERDALAARVRVMTKALNDVASWGEGETVTGLFDEPISAAIARAALRNESEGGE